MGGVTRRLSGSLWDDGIGYAEVFGRLRHIQFEKMNVSRVPRLALLGASTDALDDHGGNGHAIECRLTAEAPERGFAPFAGEVDRLGFASGTWLAD